MTASVSSPHAQVTPSGHTGTRVVLGAGTLVIGVVLLFDPVVAAHTLAVLIGSALVIGGLLELAVGWTSGHRWCAFVLGAILAIPGAQTAAFDLLLLVSSVVHPGDRAAAHMA